MIDLHCQDRANQSLNQQQLALLRQLNEPPSPSSNTAPVLDFEPVSISRTYSTDSISEIGPLNDNLNESSINSVPLTPGRPIPGRFAAARRKRRISMAAKVQSPPPASLSSPSSSRQLDSNSNSINNRANNLPSMHAGVGDEDSSYRESGRDQPVLLWW